MQLSARSEAGVRAATGKPSSTLKELSQHKLSSQSHSSLARSWAADPLACVTPRWPHPGGQTRFFVGFSAGASPLGEGQPRVPADPKGSPGRLTAPCSRCCSVRRQLSASPGGEQGSLTQAFCAFHQRKAQKEGGRGGVMQLWKKKLTPLWNELQNKRTRPKKETLWLWVRLCHAAHWWASVPLWLRKFMALSLLGAVWSTVNGLVQFNWKTSGDCVFVTY